MPVLAYMMPIVQIAGGLAALTAVAFAPPEHGDLLYLPLTARAAPVQAALADGSALLGRGPLGSVVVRSAHAPGVWSMLSAGILVVAAPTTLCGAEAGA
jgi:hypothetical protein